MKATEILDKNNLGFKIELKETPLFYKSPKMNKVNISQYRMPGNTNIVNN